MRAATHLAPATVLAQVNAAELKPGRPARSDDRRWRRLNALRIAFCPMGLLITEKWALFWLLTQQGNMPV